MSYYRTPKHPAMRSELIRRWKPWEQSTGPRTTEGKHWSTMRGYKGGNRPALRALARAIKEQRQTLHFHPTAVVKVD